MSRVWDLQNVRYVRTFWHVPAKLSPAERVDRLRRRYGSDDKLVAEIKKAGGQRVTRQTVIRWRQGKVGISEPYAQLLAELDGSQAEDFRPAQVPQAYRKEVQAIADEMRALRAELDEVWKVIGEAGLGKRGSS